MCFACAFKVIFRVQDEPTSSTSEASNSEYLYARPPCLLPRERAVPVLQPFRPMGVVDAFGTSHDLIQVDMLRVRDYSLQISFMKEHSTTFLLLPSLCC